jgi:L,D-transpeptidase catalytic domain
MSMRARFLVALFSPLLPCVLVACTPAGNGERDGEDTASADTIAHGVDRASAFVTPHPTPAEAAQIVAGYAHVDPDRTIARNLLDDALVYFDANKAHVNNLGHVVVVDFALNSAKKRFFLIDMTSGAVTPHAVAHGAGSETDGSGFARRFSNQDGSHESSLGFVVTGEIYSGVHGRSLRLDGLSPTNSNMRSRAIVVHSATYVHESPGMQGLSFGCFALDPAVKDTVVDAISGGALIYAGLGDPNTPPLPDPPPPDPTHSADAGPPCVNGDCE